MRCSQASTRRVLLLLLAWILSPPTAQATIIIIIIIIMIIRLIVLNNNSNNNTNTKHSNYSRHYKKSRHARRCVAQVLACRASRHCAVRPLTCAPLCSPLCSPARYHTEQESTKRGSLTCACTHVLLFADTVGFLTWCEKRERVRGMREGQGACGRAVEDIAEEEPEDAEPSRVCKTRGVWIHR